MKAMCLMLVLAATPVLADGSKSPPASPSSATGRDARQQDCSGAARPIVHFDSRRQQIPQSPKPGAEKPLGVG